VSRVSRLVLGVAFLFAAACIVGGLVWVDLATTAKDTLCGLWVEIVGLGVGIFAMHSWTDLR